MKKKKSRQIDYNKLIKDIVRAAKEDPAVYGAQTEMDNARLITTLKLEVKVSKNTSHMADEIPKNSTKLVMLTIND